MNREDAKRKGEHVTFASFQAIGNRGYTNEARLRGL